MFCSPILRFAFSSDEFLCLHGVFGYWIRKLLLCFMDRNSFDFVWSCWCGSTSYLHLVCVGFGFSLILWWDVFWCIGFYFRLVFIRSSWKMIFLLSLLILCVCLFFYESCGYVLLCMLSGSFECVKRFSLQLHGNDGITCFFSWLNEKWNHCE